MHIFSGNSIEKEIYHNLSLGQFIQRLLEKRCASFLGRNDKFLLISGRRGCGGFRDVGTTKEKYPLLLKHVLSYDEIKVNHEIYVELISKTYHIF